MTTRARFLLAAMSLLMIGVLAIPLRQTSSTQRDKPRITLPPGVIADDPADMICGTQNPHQALRAGLAAYAQSTCFYVAGGCDTATIRDQFIPTMGSSLLTIRMIFHVFCNDDGSGCVVADSDIAGRMAETNSDYDSARVQFSYQIRHHNDSRFSGSSNPGIDPGMYAEDPVHNLNVYVLGTYQSAGLGTFPSDASSQTSTGGIRLPGIRFNSTNRLIGHEIGHCVGLYHTHMGAFWGCDPPWSDCYEYADGSNGDVAGDFCSDTPPTPTNLDCAQPGDTDCVGTPWGQTDTANVMGYSGSFESVDCRDRFSPQQRGRMRCWTNSELICWLSMTEGDVNCSGSVDVSDAVAIINYLYNSGAPPCPLPNVADFNCDRAVDLVDAYFLIAYIFSGGPAPQCCL